MRVDDWDSRFSGGDMWQIIVALGGAMSEMGESMVDERKRVITEEADRDEKEGGEGNDGAESVLEC